MPETHLTRSELISRPFNKRMRIIEVGPSYNPVAPKSDGWGTYVVDHGSQAELIQKYQEQDVTRIEAVDCVWAGGTIDAAIPANLHGTFDGLIASHAAEHFPDYIGFLQSAARLLKPEGIIALALPDLRVCFDFFQPTSTTGDMLEAHVKRRTHHRKGRIFDEYAYYARRKGASVWLHDDNTANSFSLAHNLNQAFQEFDRASEEDDAPYTDSHAWTFTPASFKLLMLELWALNQIPYEITDTENASGTEFYGWLAIKPFKMSHEELETRRLALLKEMILERQEQINKIKPASAVAVQEVKARPGGPLTIAAIIPLYNGERYIETSLHSILEQTHPAAEIFVVNDGSTDGGPQIVQKIAQDHPQITLLNKNVPGANSGQSAARNHGIRHSSADLIAMLDQDDLWYPHHLEKLLGAFNEPSTQEIGWVYSNLDEVDENLNMVWRDFLSTLNTPHPKLNLLACLGGDMFILPSASLISRKAFDHVGGFDERLSGYEDDDLFLRLFQAGYKNIYLNEALSQWRIHTSSTSYGRRMAASRLIYMKKLYDAFPDDVVRHRFYRRDVIVPRFLNQTLSEYRKALMAGDLDLIARSWCDVNEVIALMPDSQRKRTLAWGLRILKSPAVAIKFYSSKRYLSPIMRRLKI